jgi:hypothetical protein
MKRAVSISLVLGLGLLAPAPLRAQARWTVDATPVLDIKGTNENGVVAFGSANWATRFANGTIVVADAGAPGLQYFDAKGQHLKTVGHTGQGPGDFRTVTWVARCAKDSVFAWDFPQMRITTFDGAGNLGRTFPFGTPGGAQIISACNPSGTLVLFGRGRRLPPASAPDPNAGYFIISMVAPIQLVDAAGTVTATLGEVPAGEMVGGNMNGRGGGGMPRPLGQSTSFALSADRLFVGTGDSAAVDVYSFDGKRTATLSLRVPMRASTKEQYERAAENYLSIAPAPMRETARKWVLGIPMPPRLPPYTGLFTDPDGLLWVVLSVPGDKDTQLRAIRATGAVVADAVVPVNLSVFEIGADYILGAREDADGEQHVVMFRLHRGR